MKRPMIAAAILAMILSVFVLSASAPIILFFIIIAAAFSVVCILCKHLRDFAVIFVVASVVLTVAFSALCSKIAKIEKIPTDVAIPVSGTIESEYYFEGRAVYTLKTDNSNEVVPANIKVNVYSKFASLSVGQRVKCNMYVDSISPENKAKYYSKGVYMNANVSKVLEYSQARSLTSVMAGFRDKVTDRLFVYLSPDSAASVNALTVGDKYYITDEFDVLLKRSGVSHIMVVSGMHLAIICGVVLRFLKLLHLGKRISAVVAAIFVFLFMALCGFSVSVERAGITCFIMLASLLLVRRTEALNSLCVSICIMIAINPFLMGSVAFVLSVFSAAGIIILSRPMSDCINKLLHIKGKILPLLTETVTVTLSAFIFTLPFTVYYFGCVSTVAIITNVLIGFAVNAALIMATIALPFALFSEFSIFANGLFFFTEYATRYFNYIIEYFGSKNYAYIEVNKVWFIITYLAIILSFGIIKYRYDILSVVKKFGSSIRAVVKG